MGTANGSTTKISWTNKTWNPTHGCSHVSDGCKHCYAEAISHRFGRTVKPWVGAYAAENVTLKPERLEIPFRWKEPAMCFVDSMADLFHELVPWEYVAKVWAVMALTPHITYQILTKRPERMARFLRWGGLETHLEWERLAFLNKRRPQGMPPYKAADLSRLTWPLPNVWLGTSVEDARVTDRIGELLTVPAAVRFLSCEPLIGPLELRPWFMCEHFSMMRSGDHFMGHEVWICDHCGARLYDEPLGTAGLEHVVKLTDGQTIDWVIVGGESGSGARPLRLEWISRIVDQCRAAGVPVFVKQLGAVYAKQHGLSDFKGETIAEFPPDLQIREFPNGAGRG